MNDVLFLIVSLLILSLITGLRMLVEAWGRKYRYKNAWELLYSGDPAGTARRRQLKRYSR